MPEREPYFINAKVRMKIMPFLGYDLYKQSFADVQIREDGIDIKDVLEATECLLHTFGAASYNKQWQVLTK